MLSSSPIGVADRAAWMAERTKHEAMHELCAAGIPASAVFDTRDLFSDPHLNERNFIRHVSDANGEHQATLLGWPARMSESSVDIELAPALGAHTREVLAAELGLDDAALDALAAAKVIG